MERHWCVPGGRATRPTETNVPPPPNWNRGESQNILTDFKQLVEDMEFQAGELVVIEIPIYPFFLKTPENQCAWVRNSGSKHQKGRSYHKTITVVFSPCFLEKRNNQGPHTHNIGHDINEFGHRETAG